MTEPIVDTQDEFNRQVRKEWDKAWAKDKKELIERLSVGGHRPTVTTLKIMEQCHKLGYYNGVKTKIEFVENNG